MSVDLRVFLILKLGSRFLDVACRRMGVASPLTMAASRHSGAAR
jgi:hypothetical protein